MNSFSSAFQAEVVRMARKELKPELQHLRKTVASHRSEIAALKREVKALASQLKAALRQSPPADTPPARQPGESAGKKPKADFQFEHLRQMRTALGITQAQMAQLLDASPLSVSKWESGRVRPRAAQLARIEELRRMGLRKARKKLNPA